MRSGRIPTTIIRNSINKSILIYDEQPKYSLIWLHGLGGEAQQYASFFSHSQSAVYNGCRVKIIQAPKRFITITKQQSNSWYDIRSLKRFTQPEENVFNIDHVQQSHNTIKQHYYDEILYWKEEHSKSEINPEKRVYIGGMSQGGVMSLYYGLSAAVSPAGIICFSGYSLKSTPLVNLGKLPCLIVHGNRDTTIKEVDARTSYKHLIEHKETVEYHTIKKLDHSVCLEQIGMIKSWLERTNQRHRADEFK